MAGTEEDCMAVDTDDKVDGYIELSFGPRWKYIAVVRGFVQNFLAVSIASGDLADKVAMAASELLENAVKYANGVETTVRLGVEAHTKRIDVSVSNQATPEAIAGLQALWAKVHEGQPLEAYLNLMREAATRSDGKSQLGLARIRYETNARMNLDIANGLVTISLQYDGA
jgi:hypothetical protein